MILYIIAALAVLLLLYYKTRKPKGSDIGVPEPSVLRTDLLYGYYGCETGQAEAVKGHTNLHWESQFNGHVRAADDILTMATTTVLDVMPQLFKRIADSGRNYALRADAETALVGMFEYLRQRGALQYIKAFVPIDEPNTNCRSTEDMMAALAIIRKVAAQYPELDGYKLVVIYAAAPEDWMCIEEFDVVSVDDYDEKSSILTGVYQRLVAAKRPDARTILLPGGAFGQDPTDFVNWAHADANVIGILPFCWFGPREAADKWVGIGSGPLREQYEGVGHALIGR